MVTPPWDGGRLMGDFESFECKYSVVFIIFLSSFWTNLNFLPGCTSRNEEGSASCLHLTEKNSADMFGMLGDVQKWGKTQIQESSSVPSEIYGMIKSCDSKADRVIMQRWCWQDKLTFSFHVPWVAPTARAHTISCSKACLLEVHHSGLKHSKHRREQRSARNLLPQRCHAGLRPGMTCQRVEATWRQSVDSSGKAGCTKLEAFLFTTNKARPNVGDILAAISPALRCTSF